MEHDQSLIIGLNGDMAVEAVLLVLLSALLVWSAISDLRRFLIPNAAVVAIGVGGVAWQLATGGALGATLLLAALVLVLGFAVYSLKIAGAGDVKLLSAVALWAGAAGFLPVFIHTVLIGGGLALFWLISRPLRHGLVIAGFNIDSEPPRQIPYGLAIAGAGLLMVVRLWPGS